MAQTKDGAARVAAGRVGVTYEEYLSRVSGGLKWCTGCKEWHQRSAFGVDTSRAEGLAATCLVACRTRRAAKRPRKPRTSRAGTYLVPSRDGDKKQARARVNHEVKAGRLPRPNDVPCADCGHVFGTDGIRHEYDHYLGYATEHQLDVESVCVKCHVRRDRGVTHCAHGHEYTPENTVSNGRGGKCCRTCRRARDIGRHDAAYWREYRAKKAACVISAARET